MSFVTFYFVCTISYRKKRLKQQANKITREKKVKQMSYWEKSHHRQKRKTEERGKNKKEKLEDKKERTKDRAEG